MFPGDYHRKFCVRVVVYVWRVEQDYAECKRPLFDFITSNTQSVAFMIMGHLMKVVKYGKDQLLQLHLL